MELIQNILNFSEIKQIEKIDDVYETPTNIYYFFKNINSSHFIKKIIQQIIHIDLLMGYI